MKRYLSSRYFVHYTLRDLDIDCTTTVAFRQAKITDSVLRELHDYLGGPNGEKAFIVNISKVS